LHCPHRYQEPENPKRDFASLIRIVDAGRKTRLSIPARDCSKVSAFPWFMPSLPSR
jgi:hypothetical protein